jgi:predicted nucleic acid-binding Zn ribbon protein
MPTADRLRHDIDQGRAGDKVPFSDPAAAPLGTDDEAAGMAPTPEEVELACRTELGGDALDAPAVTDERARDYSGEMDAERRRRHRVQAVWMLVAAGLMLTLGMWMFHV